MERAQSITPPPIITETSTKPIALHPFSAAINNASDYRPLFEQLKQQVDQGGAYFMDIIAMRCTTARMYITVETDDPIALPTDHQLASKIIAAQNTLLSKCQNFTDRELVGKTFKIGENFQLSKEITKLKNTKRDPILNARDEIRNPSNLKNLRQAIGFLIDSNTPEIIKGSLIFSESKKGPFFDGKEFDFGIISIAETLAQCELGFDWARIIIL